MGARKFKNSPDNGKKWDENAGNLLQLFVNQQSAAPHKLSCLK